MTSTTTEVRPGRSLARESGSMAFASLVSRLFGVIRGTLIIAALGSDVAQADIFTLAIMIPTQIYFLIGGGALNTVLVPQLVRAAKKDADGGIAYIQRITTLFMTVIISTTLLCMIGNQVILRLLARGSWHEPQNAGHMQALTVMTLLTLPQIIFMGFYLMAGQILNARGYFGPMMWAPVLNSIVQLVIFTFYYIMWHTTDRTQPFTTAQMVLLGVGTTLATVLQANWLLPYLAKAGVQLRPRWDWRGVGLGETWRVVRWSFLGVIVESLAALVITALLSPASSHGGRAAGVSMYQNANTVWMMFYGIIVVSLITARMTRLSGFAADNDFEKVTSETVRTLKLCNTFMVPISIGLMVCAQPVVWQLFGMGEGRSGVPALGLTLAAYAVGLPGYTIFYVLFRTFYATNNTFPTFWLNTVHCVINVAMAWALVQPAYKTPTLVAPAVALAFSVSHIISALLGIMVLRKLLPGVNNTTVLQPVAKLYLASAAPAVVAWAVCHFGWNVHLHAGAVVEWLFRLVVLALAAGLAAILFYFVSRALHIKETQDIVGLVIRQILRRRPQLGPKSADTVTLEMGNTSPRGVFVDQKLPIEDQQKADVPPVADDRADIEAVPRPASAKDAAESAVADLAGCASCRQGDVLGDRFELNVCLMRRGTTMSWLAYDHRLSQSALVHILAPDDPNAARAIDAARRAGLAADWRYIKVLDAKESQAGDYSAYLACEYVAGSSLESVLHAGPLSEPEICWLVREIAAALAPMHYEGLYHVKLGPDTIIITTNGNIKIVGFVIDAVLLSDPTSAPIDTREAEQTDVTALGKLLYAGLSNLWPGQERYGMRAATTSPQGIAASLQQSCPEISPQVAEVVERILDPNSAEPLRSAADIAGALSAIVGPTEAAIELERRIALRNSPFISTRQHVIVSSGESTTGSLSDADRDTIVDQEPIADDAPADQSTPTESVPTPSSADKPETAKPTDKKRVNNHPYREETPRVWYGYLLNLLVVALLIGLVATVYTLGQRDNSSSLSKPTSSPTSRSGPTTLATKYPIVEAVDFDPEGSKEENRPLAKYVFDGDPNTSWYTEQYNGPTLENGYNKKTGVGIYVALTKPEAIKRVAIQLGSGPQNVEIRVPKDPQLAPPDKITSWSVVGTVQQAGPGPVTVEMAPNTQARYILVWFTSIPKSATKGYQAAVSEIEVQG